MYNPPARGPRRAALEARRKRGRRRALLIAAGVGLILLTLAVVVLPTGNGGRDSQPQALASPEGDDAITTTLLYGTHENQDPAPAVWLTLLSIDAERETGSVVYVPAHTAAEVPGRGLQPIGDSLATGGIPLFMLSAEILLGVPIDRYIELSDKDARVFLSQLGPLTVDVPHPVRVSLGRSEARLVLAEGRQRLPAGFLVRLLYTVGVDGDDAELGARHLAFWDAVFERFSNEPEELERAVVGAGPAIGESDATAEQHASFLSTLAAFDAPARRLALLPVTQVSVGGDELYSTDEQEITRFMRDTVGRSTRRDETRVQVLNGNGVPGIGQHVARDLSGHGFRVILSGNARRLDYERTLVITYDPTDEGIALARRARDLLGVGEVQVSAQQQGIVDLTIVVGKDYLTAK